MATFPRNADYVWAKQKDTGAERPISRSMYEFAPASWDLMPDRPATDAGGNPLPTKHHTSASSEAAKKKAQSGQKADSDKENS